MRGMDDVTLRFAQVMHVYGEEWQIQRDQETGVWIAVRYPTPTAQHVLVAYDLSGLAAKLEAAQGGR
jgi:hypothetical protein